MIDAGRLALGTAQWGLRYGIANHSGQPSAGEVSNIADAAWAANVRTLDTARGYGTAEEVIGATLRHAWRVMTKIAPDVAGPGISPDEARRRTQASLAASRVALRRDRLDAVLLHRAEHQRLSGGGAWIVLQEEQAAGRIGQIGVSVVRPGEAGALLEDPSVHLIQVPANLLDRRLAGFFEAAAKHGKSIVVRSVYLQGVAHLAIDELPSHLAPLASVLARLDAVAADAGINRATLFLAWARQRTRSATVLIGCETMEQLQWNLGAWAAAGLEAAVDEAEHSIPELTDEVLDPWRWPSAGG